MPHSHGTRRSIRCRLPARCRHARSTGRRFPAQSGSMRKRGTLTLPDPGPMRRHGHRLSGPGAREVRKSSWCRTHPSGQVEQSGSFKLATVDTRRRQDPASASPPQDCAALHPPPANREVAMHPGRLAETLPEYRFLSRRSIRTSGDRMNSVFPPSAHSPVVRSTATCKRPIVMRCSAYLPAVAGTPVVLTVPGRKVPFQDSTWRFPLPLAHVPDHGNDAAAPGPPAVQPRPCVTQRHGDQPTSIGREDHLPR